MRTTAGWGATAAAAIVAVLAGCTGGNEDGLPAAGQALPSPSASSAAPEPAAVEVGSGTKPVARKPVIGRVWTTPELENDGTWMRLPPAAGTVTLRAKAAGATSVSFALVATGTGPDRPSRLLGVDRDGRDGWSVHWAYPDEPLTAHLTVIARGPGGTAEKLAFTVYHPEPLGPTIGRARMAPDLCDDALSCTLPDGAGTVTISVDVRDALSGVTFWLDPRSGESSLIGTGTREGTRYSVTWSYPDAPLQGHIRVSAGNNLGSRSSTVLSVVHP